jgi:hypothetical protein
MKQYGPWRAQTPRNAAELLGAYGGRWWIAGGWAIEAFTGVPRQHGDLDLSIPRSDVAALHEYVAGFLDVWQADKGDLRPLVHPTDPLSATCGNLWLRPGGAEPWEYDVVLMHITGATWTYKRDARISLPLEEILWAREGISYLRPEVQLLHKAPGRSERRPPGPPLAVAPLGAVEAAVATATGMMRRVARARASRSRQSPVGDGLGLAAFQAACVGRVHRDEKRLDGAGAVVVVDLETAKVTVRIEGKSP